MFLAFMAYDHIRDPALNWGNADWWQALGAAVIAPITLFLILSLTYRESIKDV